MLSLIELDATDILYPSFFKLERIEFILVSTGKLRTDDKAKYLVHPIDAISYPICLYYPIKDLTIKEFKGRISDVFGNKYDNYGE